MTSPDETTKIARGVVRKVLPNAMFDVELEDGRSIQAHLAGAARIAIARLTAGDAVFIEPAPFDRTKGRIVTEPKVRPETSSE